MALTNIIGVQGSASHEIPEQVRNDVKSEIPSQPRNDGTK